MSEMDPHEEMLEAARTMGTLISPEDPVGGLLTGETLATFFDALSKDADLSVARDQQPLLLQLNRIEQMLDRMLQFDRDLLDLVGPLVGKKPAVRAILNVMRERLQ